MAYVLKNDNEFERLESQALLNNYDYTKEFKSFYAEEGTTILDAACGTGVVSRYLATRFPNSKVIGCDIGEDNLAKGRKVAADIKNLSFETQNITSLSFKDDSFDHIICRYAIQHVEDGKRQNAVNELFRCLKPGGTLTVVDFDGTLHNIFPRSEFLDSCLNKIENEKVVDLRIGRKLPKMFSISGFQGISHSIDCLSFTDNSLKEEIHQLQSRIENAMPFFEQTFGKNDAQKFATEFLSTFKDPGLTYFYNKFSVTATKPSHLTVA